MVVSNNTLRDINGARTEISGATFIVSCGAAAATIFLTDIHWLWSIGVFFAMSVLYPTLASLSSRLLLLCAKWAEAEEPKSSEIAAWPVAVPIRLIYYFISGVVVRVFPDTDTK